MDADLLIILLLTINLVWGVARCVLSTIMKKEVMNRMDQRISLMEELFISVTGHMPPKSEDIFEDSESEEEHELLPQNELVGLKHD